jgi:hypothetical protein
LLARFEIASDFPPKIISESGAYINEFPSDGALSRRLMSAHVLSKVISNSLIKYGIHKYAAQEPLGTAEHTRILWLKSPQSHHRDQMRGESIL